MIGRTKILAVIPARGGSKGIPGKNLKELSGKPLIAWTIEEALKSKFIDNVIVNTDNAGISKVARKYGAKVPFMRPAELAKDNSGMMDVLMHCLDLLDKKNNKFDLVLLLQPTSPLRTCEDIDKAIKFFVKRKAKVIVGVTECNHPPEWTGRLPVDMNMKRFFKRHSGLGNRQDIEKSYRVNGAIYLANIAYLKKYRTWYGKSTYAFEMEREHSVDIDSHIDLKFAEFLLKYKG